MNMVDAVKSVLSKYVGFSGRARRSEFWYWKLASTLASIALGLIELAFGLSSDGSGPLSLIFGLAVFIPDLAVTFRRLHDTGRSGWWFGGFFLGLLILGILTGLIFATTMTGGGDSAAFAGVAAVIFVLGIVIYSIVMLVFLCTDSAVGPNKYGPNPKHEGNYNVFD